MGRGLESGGLMMYLIYLRDLEQEAVVGVVEVRVLIPIPIPSV